MPIPIHPSEVSAILAPFVGAKLNRYASNAEYQARPRIDISVGGMNMVDCDVREMGAATFRRPTWNRCEVWAFDKITRIKVYRWSEDGRSQIVTGDYVVSAQQVAA